LIRSTAGRAAAVLAATTALTVGLGVASASAAPAPLPASTRFFVPAVPDGSLQQVGSLLGRGDVRDASLVAKEITTPQAVWFTSGTPQQVRHQVRETVAKAGAQKAVPTLVAYDVPGRDCSQYSSGGASSDAAYQAWADGFAAGLRQDQTVVVVVEPDGLANLPSDCPTNYANPGTFPAPAPGTATAGRIADIKHLGEAVLKADRKALVYLDAGHSGWHSVADDTARLQAAGVGEFRGFSLNVSNYQWTPNLSQYGTWISDCLALHPDAATTTPTDCGDQYYSGGPANGFTGVALDAAQQWSDTATDPTANTAGINSRYAAELTAATASPRAHFVIDTSRNGQGPWTPTAGTYSGDAQTWCNPPGRGLGARPEAQPQPTAFPQLDAYQWVKTPGQSDGQCNRNVAGSTTDPEWGGITDPAAGAWFPQQALQLAQLAARR